VLPVSDLTPSGKAFAFLPTPSISEFLPAISPDSHWIAYRSNESGQPQIYVQKFPGGGNKERISEGGGTDPKWTHEGKEIVFLALDGTMMAAVIDTAKGTHTSPQKLFKTGFTPTNTNHPYVVTKDGNRFLIPVYDSTPSQMTVVVNWLASVGKK
jgi:Tol biopolymer transport system component